jgi:hypothetical protein
MVADVVVYPNDANSSTSPGANGTTGPVNRTRDGSGTLCIACSSPKDHLEKAACTHSTPRYADLRTADGPATRPNGPDLGITRRSP